MSTQQEQNERIDWLLERSMLRHSGQTSKPYIGQSRQWRHPYAAARPRDAAYHASVWFSVYPASIITAPDTSVLETLADPELWEAFADIGIRAIHTGPMKKAGGLIGEDFTPTVDGHFDRIGLEIDPVFGTVEEYFALCQQAKKVGGAIIDDIVPGHTGKGPDFRLAELAYKDFPGLYHMVEIDPSHWSLLPDVPEGQDSVNLSPSDVDALHERGYIVGRLSRVIFYEPGVKETNWSATDPIVGVDGVERRWVYLHYFKQGQPTLNWLDPTFAAARMVIGDALHSIDTLGVSILRLDANGFLGIEASDDGSAWSEGHPLSITANQLVAGMVRKAGGFTFQELNLTVDDIADMSNGGADLSYDFITRPAYHHALVTGDTEFLRMMLRTVHEYDIDPASLVHAMQNHDELTLELVHFWTKHRDDEYTFNGQTITGSELRDRIRGVMYMRLTGEAAPYNLRFVTNGVASTTVSVVAAALGIQDIWNMSDEQKALVQRAHLLLAMFNALQPGVFVVSGWDLIGALPLRAEEVEELLADGDTRWINRGAYDLMHVNPDADKSSSGLPRAESLYGPIPEQLENPDSFVNRLSDILTVRANSRLYAARQITIPDVQSKGLLVMVHELPEDSGMQVTALNFSSEPIDETLALGLAPAAPVIDMFNYDAVGEVSAMGGCRIQLDPYSGRSLSIT